MNGCGAIEDIFLNGAGTLLISASVKNIRRVEIKSIYGQAL